MHHRRSVRAGCLSGFWLGLGLIPFVAGSAGAASAAKTPQDKVTICHANNSVESPYVQHTVNVNSIVMSNGQPTSHGLHEGPIYPNEDWGDVIPPFTYTNDHGGSSRYHGANWGSDGQAIWNGGCDVIIEQPPIESPTTTTSAPTTTSLPGSTTSILGSTTSHPASTTSHPASTTTSTEPPPGTVPTTPPSSELPHTITDPGVGAEIVPPVDAIVIDPGDVTVELGPLDPTQREELETEIDSLAATGQNTQMLALGALTLIVVGSLLVLGARRQVSRPRRHRAPGRSGPSSP